MPFDLRNTLKDVFGYDRFRPLQEAIITRLLSGGDTLAVLPTGGGKSLCYQLPALAWDGLTLVVSPLIALMRDQVQQLEVLGIPALTLNSSMGAADSAEARRRLLAGEVKLLFAAPESLLSSGFQNLLDRLTVSAFVIDEAHCISEWGHEFRPEYRRLAELRRRWPQAVCLALTASATPRVREDIRATLGLDQAAVFLAGFDRPNLHLMVRPKDQPRAQALQFIRDQKGRSGIVYTFSRRGAEDLASWLSSQGIPAGCYHAGLSDDERRRTQDAFLKDDLPVMCATVAFGMGINKSNVSWILHYDLPKSLENYYQEIGRAGRDGSPATTLLLYGAGDAVKLRRFLEESETSDPGAGQRLAEIEAYARNLGCRRQRLLTHFGDVQVPERCSACDNCLEPPQLTDRTLEAQKLLSCAYRSGQRYGAKVLADILTGLEDEQMRARGLDKISTFGIGRDQPPGRWMRLARALTDRGYFEVDPDYKSLKLSPLALQALKFQDPILVREEPEAKRSSPRRRHAPETARPEGGLFEALRRLRKQLADEAAVPPYVIFSDRSLADMVEQRPQTAEAFRLCYGVGQKKAERFAGPFLEAIRVYEV